MDKTAACAVAVLVLLAGAACPLAAAQGGPPEHANDDGAGPPDRGDDSGSGDADQPGSGGSESDESDDDGEEDVEGDASEGNDDGDESDSRVDESDSGGGGEGSNGEGSNAPSSGSDSDSESESGSGSESESESGSESEAESESESDSDSEESVLPFLDPLVEDSDGGSNSTSGDADDSASESTPSDTPTEAVENETRAEPTATREATARPTATSQETQTVTPNPTATPTPTYEPLVPDPRSDGETTPGANESTPTTPSSTPSGESSADGDGTDDATDGSTSIDPGPVVDQGTAGNSTTASVSGVDRGERVAVDLRGPAADGEGVDVRSISVGGGGDGPFELAVSRPTTDGPDESDAPDEPNESDAPDESNESDAPDEPDGPAPGVSLAYFDVESSHEPVSNATLTVEVPSKRLPSGVGPDDVEVLRYDGGEWTTAETDAGDREDTYVADVQGFSSFAVAMPDRRPLSVTDATLQADWVRTGHEVTASAVVSNPVDRPASERLTVTLDGEPAATRNVTLDGGEETRLQVDVPATSPGNRTVAIGGAEAGQLRVADESTSTPAAGGDSDLGFGVAAAAVVVLGALATGLLVVRSEAWDRGD